MIKVCEDEVIKDLKQCGVNVDKNDLKREIENPEILTYIYK